jgi:hypothetical protein
MTSSRSGGRVLAQAAQAFAPLIDLVYPPRCPICGNATANQDGLCAPCWSGLVIPGDPACATCSRPFPSDMTNPDGAQCAVCLERMPKHSGIYAGTIYNDASNGWCGATSLAGAGATAQVEAMAAGIQSIRASRARTGEVGKRESTCRRAIPNQEYANAWRNAS